MTNIAVCPYELSFPTSAPTSTQTLSSSLTIPTSFLTLLLLNFLLPLLLFVLLGWAAADSDWSGRTWGSPYAIAVMDIEGFVQENQGGGSGGCKYCTLTCSYCYILRKTSVVHDRDMCDYYLPYISV